MSVGALVQRIEQELSQIQAAATQTQRLICKVAQVEDEDIRTALVSASVLNMQSFYTGAERIFYEIAKEVDGYVPVGADWHRQLLEQMSVEIPAVRQAKFDSKHPKVYQRPRKAVEIGVVVSM